MSPAHALYLDALQSWSAILQMVQESRALLPLSEHRVLWAPIREDVRKVRGVLNSRTDSGNGIESVVQNLGGVLEKIEVLTSETPEETEGGK